MEQEPFTMACSHVLDKVREAEGIGTLSEKTIHAVLKAYYSPDVTLHEKKILGFVADICREGEIIEIQTRNFNTLRRKLDAFLLDYDVTIVYPVAHTKWLRWIDPSTGEISSKRKSPKTGTKYSVFKELYRIKNYLANEKLHVIIALLDVEEYRTLNGWSTDKKKGSTRNDGIPVELFDEVIISSVVDYAQFIPDSLLETFSVKDFKAATKLPLNQAGVAVHILNYLGLIERTGKQGNALIYKRTNKD